MEAVQQAMESTATDLGWLLDEIDDAVVTLVAGETRLLVHRAVLTDRSPVFGAIFQQEACSDSVSIPDVEGPVLRQLVAYLYRLQAPQLPAMAPQLLAAADKYGLSGLKEACEQQVAAQLTVETAAAAAVLAIRHSCVGLREAAIDFIKSHTHQVMATQGWADAVRMQPEGVVEMGRLLSETSTTASATVDSGTSATPAPQSLGDHSGRRQTPASAAPPTAAAHRGSPPDEDADSRVRRPAAVVSGTPAPQPLSDRSGRRQSPASAALPTAAAHHGSPPDEDADSRIRRPATVDRGTSPSPAPQPLSDHSGRRQTPASAAVCRLRRLSAKEKGERLIEAAKQGAVEELEALLAAGADVEARDITSGATALQFAAGQGREEAVRRLLAAGAAVDNRDGDSERETPLHWAAGRGHASVVRLLLDAGAERGARTCFGSTPLHWAAEEGHTEAAAALLEGGADRAAWDKGGETPLDRARRNNRQQVVQLLLQGRERPTAGTGLQSTAQKF